MSLMLYQQITGQPSVLYYASKIFEEAGFASGSEVRRRGIGWKWSAIICEQFTVLLHAPLL